MQRAGFLGPASPAVRLLKTLEGGGWVLLAANALLGIVAAVVTTMPPVSWFWDPLYTSAYSLMGMLAATWIGFYALALAVILIPFRRDERWAWFALWALPLHLLLQAALTTGGQHYLTLAAIAALGLVLPVRRFFSAPRARTFEFE
jgi:hypothetical protein